MEAGEVISFGPCRLERASGRLLRRGTDVRLRRKTFAVLEYLASRPGRLASKDELLDAVWCGTHVTPSVLAGCIRELRQAIGDDARAPQFVETVHRRGYRFIAAPAESAEERESPGLPPMGRLLLLGHSTELAALAHWLADTVAGRTAGVRGRGGAAPARTDALDVVIQARNPSGAHVLVADGSVSFGGSVMAGGSAEEIRAVNQQTLDRVAANLGATQAIAVELRRSRKEARSRAGWVGVVLEFRWTTRTAQDRPRFRPRRTHGGIDCPSTPRAGGRAGR